MIQFELFLFRHNRLFHQLLFRFITIINSEQNNLHSSFNISIITESKLLCSEKNKSRFLDVIKLMRSRIRKAKNLKESAMKLTGVFGQTLHPSLTYKVPNTVISLNKQIFDDIRNMKLTAAKHRLAYLTANQVSSFYRVCILHKSITPTQGATLNTSTSFDRPEDYVAYINPQIVEGKNLTQLQETCLTYPFIRFKVDRFLEITLKYKNEIKQTKEQAFTGQISHFLQHCVSHLDGKLLMDWDLSHGKFFIEQNSAAHFPKTNFLLKQLSFRLKDFHSKSNPTPDQIKKYSKIREDYMSRLETQYLTESQRYSKKIEEKKIDIM